MLYILTSTVTLSIIDPVDLASIHANASVDKMSFARKLKFLITYPGALPVLPVTLNVY